MPWTSLAERLDDLPLVLAGPMLRRVTPESVSVWLALRKSVSVQLKIDLVEGFASKEELPVKIGPNLHIICVTATSPNPQDPRRTLKPCAAPNNTPTYTYDIKFGNGQSLATALARPNTSEDALRRISYDNIGSPSFVLPPRERSDLCIVHGS